MCCDNCGKTKKQISKEEGNWWNLSDYHHVTGYFCPLCFELVSHNHNEPRHPTRWSEIAVMQALHRKTNQ